MKNILVRVLLVCIAVFFFSQAQAALFVSNLKATYRNGQTFLTWTCPAGTNLKYKIYRSKSILDIKSKLNTTNYMGYVIDSSSLNVRKTRKTGSKTFFSIQDGGSPLSANQGLYVITCTANNSFYYAVTVTDQSLKEYKKITLGISSLLTGVSESIADPQPVLQGTEVLPATGDQAYDYVWFGNNQDLANYPSMFNQGSYGFNFYIVYRGNYQNGPLFMFHEGLEGNALVGNGLGSFDTISNCTIISNDDWIPVPTGYGPTSGMNTFWSGYHENFNPYVLNSPIPTSGVVRMYQQHRYIYTIDWASKYLPIDSNRIYIIGVSAGGFGALLTAMIVPQKIAAVYTIVAPVVIKSVAGDPDTTDEQLWGNSGANLPTDINDPNTGLPLGIFDLMNIKTMLSKNQNVGLPPIYSIHGKNDATVYWSDKPTYLNQNESYDQGGTHFWDQRSHDGGGANFTDAETTPNFSMFRKNLSYPAFANCTVNENPGNGTPSDGDAYGSYSGFITWDTITDDPCEWTCHMGMIKYTVGGVEMHSDYTYCNADVTIRRPQFFAPAKNDDLKWTTYDKDNAKIANGSFTYNGGPITVPGLKIKRSGTRLEISIKKCNSREGNDDALSETAPQNLSVLNTFDGWQVSLNSSQDQTVLVQLIDVLGRIVKSENIHVSEGQNLFSLKAPQHGTYIVNIKGNSIQESAKVIY